MHLARGPPDPDATSVEGVAALAYRDRVDLAQRFRPLLGSWTGVEEQAAAPRGRATSARAALTFKLDLAGTAVVQDYRQVRADGAELLGHGVFLAGPADGSVLWWFFDSDAQPPVPAPGRWGSSGLTLTRTGPWGTARHRFTAGPGRLGYTIEVGAGPGATMSPFLSGRYRQVSGH